MSADTESPTADYLARAIEHSYKTERQIAEEVGLPKTNMVSLMKHGLVKLPIERIPAFARACSVPAIPFLATALNEYAPEAWQVIVATYGETLTEDEVAWLGIYRTLHAREPRGPIGLDTDFRSAVTRFALGWLRRDQNQ